MPLQTVGDLIAALQEFDPDAPIALATQPGWPITYPLTGLALARNGTVYATSRHRSRTLTGGVIADLGLRESADGW